MEGHQLQRTHGERNFRKKKKGKDLGKREKKSTKKKRGVFLKKGDSTGKLTRCHNRQALPIRGKRSLKGPHERKTFEESGSPCEGERFRGKRRELTSIVAMASRKTIRTRRPYGKKNERRVFPWVSSGVFGDTSFSNPQKTLRGRNGKEDTKKIERATKFGLKLWGPTKKGGGKKDQGWGESLKRGNLLRSSRSVSRGSCKNPNSGKGKSRKRERRKKKKGFLKERGGREKFWWTELTIEKENQRSRGPKVR